VQPALAVGHPLCSGVLSMSSPERWNSSTVALGTGLPFSSSTCR
jgi:hypothetical protein